MVVRQIILATIIVTLFFNYIPLLKLCYARATRPFLFCEGDGTRFKVSNACWLKNTGGASESLSY